MKLRELLNAMLNVAEIELCDAYTNTVIDYYRVEQLLEDEPLSDCEISNFEITSYDNYDESININITIFDETHQESDEAFYCYKEYLAESDEGNQE